MISWLLTIEVSSLPPKIGSHIHFAVASGKDVLMVVRVFIIEITYLEMEAYLNCS